MGFYVLSGLVWLLVTVALGGRYALDWHFGWFPITDAMVAAHAHLGLAGWLSLVLMGVSYKLMAMFSLAHGHGERLALWNLGIWNAGLIGLAVSVWVWPAGPLVPLFAAWLAVWTGIFVFDMGRLLRRRRRFSLEQWHAFVSFASLLVAAVMGVALAAGHPLTRTWIVAYGYTAVVGWFGFSIVGKYYKIIPFLSWLERFSRVAGRAPTPLLKDMVDVRLGWISFGFLVVGYAGVLTGPLARSLPALQGAGSLYSVGAALFAVNVARVLWPRVAAITTRKEVA